MEGGTKGPDSFNSLIGKQLGKDELRFKSINFKKVKGGKIPNLNVPKGYQQSQP